MSLDRFLERIKGFAVFKHNPKNTAGKDIDIFIQSIDEERFTIAIQDFLLVECFYVQKYKSYEFDSFYQDYPFESPSLEIGWKKRYVVYDDGEFKLIDLQINGYYHRGLKVMSWREIINNRKTIKGGFDVLKKDDTVKIWTLKHRMLWIKNLIKRPFSNEGCIIALLGPDGVGKSSLANLLEKKINCAFNAEQRYFGWRNFTPLMKAAYKVYKPNNKNDKSLTWSRLLAYYSELLIRYYSMWLRKTFLGRIIILDRYFYDKLTLIPKNSLKYYFFNMITPRPDYTFLLRAEPKNILKRKKELTKTQIMILYINFLSMNKNFININADQSLNNEAKEITDKIASKLIRKKMVTE